MSDEIRIASVNMMAGGSTGHIMLQVARVARAQGMAAQTFSTRAYTGAPQPPLREIEGHRLYGWHKENWVHTVMGKVTGYNGFFSFFGTLLLSAL